VRIFLCAFLIGTSEFLLQFNRKPRALPKRKNNLLRMVQKYNAASPTCLSGIQTVALRRSVATIPAWATGPAPEAGAAVECFMLGDP